MDGKSMSKPRIEKCKSYPVSIFMAGDYDLAKQWAQHYCDEVGFCVTVTKTEYVYTGGSELGVIIGLINYPRFPNTPMAILDRAEELAELLIEKLNQESYSIQTPEKTYWTSYRVADRLPD
jgi:hypothetical protein